MAERTIDLERWLSWSKAHDWKSCVPRTGYRGFESLSLRHRKGFWRFTRTPLFIKFFVYCDKIVIYLCTSEYLQFQVRPQHPCDTSILARYRHGKREAWSLCDGRDINF